MTPTVTLEGDIRLDITLDSSSRGADVSIGGVNIPSFVQRTVTTRLRLRDGESNLLAGLYQENDQNGVSGFPGAIHVPFLKQVFSSNTSQTDQIDIVMLLTPHIVRTHEITEADLRPIYIGSQQNLGVGGPPPLIAGQPEAPPAQAPVAPAPPAAGTTLPGPIAPGQVIRGPGGTTVAVPPGTTPVPGTVLAPTPPAPVAVPVTGARASNAAGRHAKPGHPGAGHTAGRGGRTGTAARTAGPPDDVAGRGRGAGADLAAKSAVPRRWRSLYVALSITGAQRLSTVTLTLIFDPTKLRVRAVQEGSFMRAGGVNVSFTQQAERQPRRHHAHARRRRGRRVRHRTPGGDSVRCHRGWPRHHDTQRHGDRTGRHGHGAAVHTGHGDGAVSRG
jgi:hypothetical protein